MNSNPYILIPGNDLPCVNGSLIRNKFDRAYTSFPGARSYPSFPWASGYLSLFVRHAFFALLRIFEEFQLDFILAS